MWTARRPLLRAHQRKAVSCRGQWTVTGYPILSVRFLMERSTLATAGAASVSSSASRLEAINQQIIALLEKQKKASDELTTMLVDTTAVGRFQAFSHTHSSGKHTLHRLACSACTPRMSLPMLNIVCCVCGAAGRPDRKHAADVPEPGRRGMIVFFRQLVPNLPHGVAGAFLRRSFCCLLMCTGGAIQTTGLLSLPQGV